MGKFIKILIIIFVAFIIMQIYAVYQDREQIYESTYDVPINIGNIEQVRNKYEDEIMK